MYDMSSGSGFGGADYAYANEAEGAVESPIELTSSTRNAIMPKLIYRASLRLESTEFDEAAARIDALVEKYGGYFESSSIFDSGYSGYRTGRSASYSVRVPSSNFNAFLDESGEVAHVTYKNRTAEDVSEWYFDLEGRLATLETKQARLLELLERAEEMEDIIVLENSLYETSSDIESYSGQLQKLSSLIDYSVVSIELVEVYKVTDIETVPESFGQRLANAFKNGIRNFGDELEDFAVYIAYNVWDILVLIVVIVVIVLIIRKIGSSRRRRRQERLNSLQNSEQKPPKE